ncbi:uncharacterized protein LOC132315596 [Cornus florida]|uniref:uncharacterized protein LOC132315596 n=1 Tax=Cornus florida TaxID=4283 RepID=UPI0028A10BA5|nr:uncharacterized protein LOC132315596 [Cornus florida]
MKEAADHSLKAYKFRQFFSDRSVAGGKISARIGEDDPVRRGAHAPAPETLGSSLTEGKDPVNRRWKVLHAPPMNWRVRTTRWRQVSATWRVPTRGTCWQLLHACDMHSNIPPARGNAWHELETFRSSCKCVRGA